jgi:response regulator RpfG family c-di-GMP phosphodiesterase
MSIFNPWAEVRRLKAQLEAGYETYRIEETQQQAEWAKKEARLLKLERDNADLITELTVRGLVIEQRNNAIKSLKEQLAKAVDPRDPKTGRFTKKVN